MFTGIVTDIGTVVQVIDKGDRKFHIKSNYDLSTIAIGASIAHSGVCLTVKEIDLAAGTYLVEASAETLSKTNLGTWHVGQRINLERSLRMGDELGGHLMFGHVDGLAEIVSITPEGESHRIKIRLPDSFGKFVAAKGSISLDGVSLTVNEVAGNSFGVNIIPHTWEVTTLGDLRAGDRVHFEIDMLARYVARMYEGGMAA